MNGLLTPRKLIIKITIAFMVLLVVVFVCSMIGTQKISLKAVLHGAGDSSTANLDYEIFMKFRLPRIILACLVGAALACAGAVFQALLRNPLADPYILGISSGAGLGAILAIITGLNWMLLGRSSIGIFAFAGAICSVWLVWFIGRLTGKFHVTGLLLAGVVVNAFFSAIIMFLTSIANSSEVHSTIFWLMGNLAEQEPLVLWNCTGIIIAALAALFFISPQLNAMSFSEDDARSMGISIRRTRMIAFAIASAITAVSVSLSGLIGFVGLVVPHSVRLVFGPDHRQLFPLCAVVGAIFLIIADTLARTIVAPAQMPVGVLTAIVGGPFFLFLLVKYCRKVSWLK